MNTYRFDAAMISQAARRSRALLAPILALFLSACTGSRPPAPSMCAQRILERAYFGMNTPDGEVTEREWRRFVDEEVTPRFPDGLTIIEGQGQWRGESGRIVREPSRILEIVHPESPSAEESVADIARAYRKRFSQEAVLVLKSPASACF